MSEFSEAHHFFYEQNIFAILICCEMLLFWLKFTISRDKWIKLPPLFDFYLMNMKEKVTAWRLTPS